MIRVNANIFRRAMLLLSLIVLPSVVLGDAGHDAKKEPAGMEGMDHSKMKMDGHGDAADAHWMAPDKAAKRPNPVKADKASVARGKKLFEANCASCHGYHRILPSSDPASMVHPNNIASSGRMRLK